MEIALGEAEDYARVESLAGTFNAPAASCNGDCLVTFEATPLESDALENKYYLSGVGLLGETDLTTGEVAAVLTAFSLN